jgi:BASS family bile acid:Na+ symporter
MIVGALSHRFLYQLMPIMPWLVFLMLLFSFARIAPREVKFNRLHLLLLAIQLVGCLGVYALIYPWNPLLAQAAMICVMAPTATSSAVITGLLGGSVGFLTTYIIACNLFVSTAAPVIFSYVGVHRELPFLESAWIIARQVMPILIFPLLTAWAIRWLSPRMQRWFERMSQAPFYLWALSLTIVTGQTVHFLFEQEDPDYVAEWSIAAAAAVLCFVQFRLGRWLGRRTGDPVSAGQALMQKNTVLALWMSQMYLNPLASIGPAAYILWQNILNSWQLWRKK